jgi:hypothetical protein
MIQEQDLCEGCKRMAELRTAHNGDKGRSGTGVAGKDQGIIIAAHPSARLPSKGWFDACVGKESIRHGSTTARDRLGAGAHHNCASGKPLASNRGGASLFQTRVQLEAEQWSTSSTWTPHGAAVASYHRKLTGSQRAYGHRRIAAST